MYHECKTKLNLVRGTHTPTLSLASISRKQNKGHTYTDQKGKTTVHGCPCPGDMAVCMCEVLARPWDGVCVPVALSLSYWIYWHTNQGNSWYAFPAHPVGGLRCGSQPIAPTCIVWSWRLKECFALALAEKCLWDTGSPCSLNRQLCHADEPQKGRNSYPWLPRCGWYDCAHVWGTGQAVGWCMCASCVNFVSPQM